VPQKVIGDKAYDSDPLDKRLADERGVEMIAPHKDNRRQESTQDGRPYGDTESVGKLNASLPGFKTFVDLLFVMNIILRTSWLRFSSAVSSLSFGGFWDEF